MGQTPCEQCPYSNISSQNLKNSNSVNKISYPHSKLFSSISNLTNDAKNSQREIHYSISFASRLQALQLFQNISSQTQQHKNRHTLKITSCDIQQTKSIKPQSLPKKKSYVVRIQFERAIPFLEYISSIKKMYSQKLIWNILQNICQMAQKFNINELNQILEPTNIFIILDKEEEIWKLIEARLFLKNKKIHHLLANGLSCGYLHTSIMKKICISLIQPFINGKSINSKQQLIKLISPLSFQTPLSSQLKNLFLQMLEGLITFKGVIKRAKQYLYKNQNSFFNKANRRISNSSDISLGSTLKIGWQNRDRNAYCSLSCCNNNILENSDIVIERIRDKIAAIKSETYQSTEPFSSKIFIQYPKNPSNQENKENYLSINKSDSGCKSSPFLLNLATVKLTNFNEILTTDKKNTEEDNSNKIVSTRITQNDNGVKTLQKNSEIFAEEKQLIDETPQQTNKKNYDSESMLLTQNMLSNDNKVFNEKINESCSEFEDSQCKKNANPSPCIQSKRITSIVLQQDKDKINWNWVNRELFQKINTQKSYGDQQDHVSIVDYRSFELQNKCATLIRKKQPTYQLQQSYLKPQGIIIKDSDAIQKQQQIYREHEDMLSSIKSSNPFAVSGEQLELQNEQSIQEHLISQQEVKQQISPLSPVQQYEKYKDLNEDSISYFIEQNPIYYNQTIYEQSNQEDISSCKHTQIKKKLIQSLKSSDQDKQSLSQIIKQMQVDANSTINKMVGLRVSRVMLSSCSHTRTIYENSQLSSEKVSSQLSKSYRILSQQSQLYQGYVRIIETQQGEQLIREGTGKNVYSDGTIYQGQWVNNQPDGFGKLINCVGQIIYEGYWKEGKYNGRGKLYNTRSQFQEDKQKMQNKVIFDEYVFYQGLFKEGEMFGKGLLHFESCIFEGEFGDFQKIWGALYLQDHTKRGEFRRQNSSQKLQFYETN